MKTVPIPLSAGLRACAGVVTLTVLVLLPAALLGHQRPPPQEPTPRIAVRATTVMVDVVVRDKGGRPVGDLAATDFELHEDGVRQDITSVQLFAPETALTPNTPGATGRPAAEAAAPPPAGSPGGPTVVALVFDRLSPEARDVTKRAALAYVDESRPTQDYTGVFLIDMALHTVQPYTRDATVLREAVERATSAAAVAASTAAAASQQSGNAKALIRGSATAGEVGAAESAGGGAVNAQQATRPAGQAGASVGAGDAVDRRLAELQVSMDSAFEALHRDQQGYATTNGLLAVVHSLQGMPGRKTLIFFSEGVAIPPAVEHHFHSVIDAANRANVSIYTLDAGGLRVRSNLAETRRTMAENASSIESNREAGIMMKGMERNEDTLRLSAESGLGTLANETGGLFFQNTNDLRTGMRQIEADRHHYYLLTYSPKNDEFDGTFRQISVKVRRPGVEVRARKGYRAVRSTGPAPVLDFEAPGLAVLDAGQAPNAFPLQAAALLFPELKRPGLVPVIVQLRTDVLRFREDRDKKRYAADFSVVVRLKDRNEQVVRKLSQRYELGGPITQLEQAKRGEVLFYREPELTPGVYTLEAIVHDAVAEQSSARIATVEVPAADPASLRVSTLMIVRRSEKVPAAERSAANPLYFGDVVLYPNLGEPLRKGTDKELTFAATIYPASSGAGLHAALELLQNGTPLGQAPVQLPAPDASGRIQYVGRLPIERLTPGRYELRLTVADSGTRHVRTATFMITP